MMRRSLTSPAASALARRTASFAGRRSSGAAVAAEEAHLPPMLVGPASPAPAARCSSALAGGAAAPSPPVPSSTASGDGRRPAPAVRGGIRGARYPPPPSPPPLALDSNLLFARRTLSSAAKGEEEDKSKDEGGAADGGPAAYGETSGTSPGQEGGTKKKKKSLRDAVHRAKSKDGEESTAPPDDASHATNEVYDRLRSAASSLFSAVSQTWQDLLESDRPKSINKRIHEPVRDLREGEVAEDDHEAADRYEGTTAVMVIDPDEHLTAWERMQRRLAEAPVIQEILGKSHELYVKSGAAKAKEKLDHIKEDAHEAWETSQNPWVYRASSVYDTLTAETEFAIAVRELRELDPDFTLEGWRRDVVEHTLPDIMKLFLEGRIKELKPWLGEAVYNRIAAEVRARKKEGVEIDTHVLGIMNSEILACEPDTVNKGSPIILLHYMCQQINCVRKKEDGTVVEGGEDDIRANSYVVAFQREYDEKEGELNWRIIDFRFNGAIAYL